MNDSDDVINVPAQVNSAQQLPPNLVLLKMENENMMAAAAIRPRSPAKIVQQLRELIEAFPQSADDAIYSKPVGKVKRVNCGACGATHEVSPKKTYLECPKCGNKNKQSTDGREVMKFAEGLSIRAAETIRSIFGYTRLATTTELMPDGCARISGMFVDYAAGNITSDERIVSNYYTSFKGDRTYIEQDRFLALNVKGEKSKLRRDIILDSVPNEVKAAYIDACEKKLAGLVTPEKVEKEILPWFASRGISLDHLEKMIGRTLKMGWTEEDRLQLKKVASALKNDEVSVAELIRDIEGKNDVAGGGKVAESDLNAKFGGKKDDTEQSGNAEAAQQGTVDNAQQGTAPAGDDNAYQEWEAKIGDSQDDQQLNVIETGFQNDKRLSPAQRDTLGGVSVKHRRTFDDAKKSKKKPGEQGTLV